MNVVQSVVVPYKFVTVPVILTLKTPLTWGLLHDIYSVVGLKVMKDMSCPLSGNIVAV
jgi:hypothetical protein